MRHGDHVSKDKFRPLLLSTDPQTHWHGAVFMTEKEGGTDVARFTTVARRDGDQWRIYSDKWFCSNADAPLVMTLARPEDEDGNTIPGLTGLGLFLIPRTLDDGTPNAYRIVRPKHKTGTRSMGRAEKIEGAAGWG